MLERVKKSFILVKESFRVLMLDKELLLFPIISGLAIVSLFIVFVYYPIFKGQDIEIFFKESFLGYLWIVLFLLVSSFIVIFFNVALISCVALRLKGKDPTLVDGFKSAFKNVIKIAVWALVATTIGLLIDYLDRLMSRFGTGLLNFILRIFTTFALELVWVFATFFVVPVMIFENYNVFNSIKRSAQLFKKTWGESVVGQFSIGLFFMFATVISILLLAGLGIGAGIILDKSSLDYHSPLIYFFSVFISSLFLIIIFIIIVGFAMGTALNGIYNTVLYTYATSRKIPIGFSKEFVSEAYRKSV